MPPPTRSLEGKVALVTGAGKGIGAGIAHELGARGAKVAINYNSSATPAQTLAQEIQAAGSDALALQADISQPEEIEKLFQAVLRHYGHLDLVVSNSGIEHFAPLESVQPADFDRVFNLNTRGQFFVGQAAYRHLSDNGRLILMSSISARNAIKQHAVYAGSKCAVEAFARCFASEFGARGITVNSISPGGVKTDMVADVGHKYIPGADASWTLGDIEDFVTKRTPMARMAVPLDIARVVVFLASEDGGWMSGESLCSRSQIWCRPLADGCRAKSDGLGRSGRMIISLFPSKSCNHIHGVRDSGPRLGDCGTQEGNHVTCLFLPLPSHRIMLALAGASGMPADFIVVCERGTHFRMYFGSLPYWFSSYASS